MNSLCGRLLGLFEITIGVNAEHMFHARLRRICLGEYDTPERRHLLRWIGKREAGPKCHMEVEESRTLSRLNFCWLAKRNVNFLPSIQIRKFYTRSQP